MGQGIRRDPQAAAEGLFDLIVVGGGIHGIMVALEATRRRLRPLLLERDDFGGGTTQAALRLLQKRPWDLRSLLRTPAAPDERFWWWRHFPMQVEPQPVLMPLLDGEGPPETHPLHRLERRLRRLRGDEGDPALPEPRLVSRAEVIAACPPLARPELTGGMLWQDLAVPSPARLCLEALRWACITGATALNYVEALDLVVADDAVAGVDARDQLRSRHLRFRAPVVIAAAGPWTFDLLGRSSVAEPPHRPAWHALVGRVLSPGPAVAWRAPAVPGETIHLLPGTQSSSIGPVVQPGYEGGWPDWRVVRLVLERLAAVMPDLEIADTEVVRLFSSRMTRGAGEDTVIVDVARRHGPRGLYALFGGRLADARRSADRVLRLAFPGNRPEPYATFERPRLGFTADAVAVRGWLRGQGLEQLRRIALEEAVVHLDDLMLRRTPLGDRPHDAMLLAEEACRVLGYGNDRRQREIERLRRALAPPLRRPPAWLRSAERQAPLQPA